MEHLNFKIGPSFWLFLAVAAILKQGYFAATYTVAMVLHEFAHYFVAKKLFYRCTEIKISIFGAVLYGDFSDVCGPDRIKIALAGPLCNLILCLACLALWWIVPSAYFFTEKFCAANISMACVNLLPCYPLDGGRILTGILEKADGQKALKITKAFTCVFSAVMFCIFVLSLFSGHRLFSLGLFSVFLFGGVLGTSNARYIRWAFGFDRRTFLKRGMEKKILVFDENSKLCDVAKRMQGNYIYCLEVVDGDMNVKKQFSVSQLEDLVVTAPMDSLLKDLSK